MGEDGVAVFVGDVEAGFFFEKSKAPVAAKIRTTAANARTYWLRLMGTSYFEFSGKSSIGAARDLFFCEGRALS